MPIISDNSGYPVLKIDNPSEWKKLKDLCLNRLTEGVFSQLVKYLSPDIKSILVEQEYIDKDYRDTYSNFYSKKFARYSSRTVRLHFWNNRLDGDDRWKLHEYSNDYIGHMIVRPTRINPIGRTILNPQKLSSIVDGAHLSLANFKANVLGSELTVKGFPYISQDTDVTICAHAACWMLLRYFSEKYTFYREVWPYEISQMTKDISSGRLIPSRGLTISQVAEIFHRFGFHPVIYSKDTKNPSSFYRHLYNYIESGLPVVAGMSKKEHAITIIGHYSDYEKKLKSSNCGIIGTEEFVEGFIINDDNHMPYQSLCYNSSDKPNHKSDYIVSDVDTFIVPLYEKIYLQAEHANDWIKKILNAPDLGFKAPRPTFQTPLILRVFLTSSRSYKKFRLTNSMGNKNIERILLQLPMPKFIWIGEISTPELYPEKSIGEIILDSTAATRDPYCFQWVHYPGLIVINDRNIVSDNPYKITCYEVDESFDGYTNYEHNLEGVLS